MRYTCSIEIDLPIDAEISKFDNTQNMKHWQPGLVSFEHISGESGEVGAVSRLKYLMGKREIEMVETITKKELPHSFEGTYDTKGAYNEIKNSFSKAADNKTIWTSENYFEFSGFMKVIAFLMPGAFKKQSMKYMHFFKEFAETGKSVLG